MGNAVDIQKVLQSTEKVHGSNKMLSNPLQGLPEEPKNFAYDSLTETSATYREPGKYRKFAQRFVRSYWLMNEEYGTIATEHFSDENTIFYTVGDLRKASLYQVCPALLNDKTKGLPDVPRKLRHVDDRLIETTLFFFAPEKYQRYSQIYVRLKDVEKDEVKETIDTFHSVEKGSLFEILNGAQNEVGNSEISEKLFTQTKGLPPDILRMDKKSVELYKQALAEGCIPDYNIRVMIVGHSNVGKTTLKMRLFDEIVDIKERKTTHGVEVDVGHCKVNMESGEWIIQEKDSPSQTGEKSLSPSKAKSSSYPAAQLPGHSAAKSQSHSTAQPVEPPVVLGGKEKKSAKDISYRRDKEMCLADVKEILKQTSKNPDVQNTCELSIWDFAGQSDYYAMHQVFLAKQAVYLLVTKLTEHMNDTSDDQRSVDCTEKKYLHIGDFIEFWLNSIYEYVGNDESHDPARQNVILVGTHADKITEDSKDSSESNVFDTVRMSLADKVTFNLLTERDFRVNNTIGSTDPSSTIKDMRKYILEIASKQSYWGKQIPAKWCNLENILMKLRIKGTKK